MKEEGRGGRDRAEEGTDFQVVKGEGRSRSGKAACGEVVGIPVRVSL